MPNYKTSMRRVYFSIIVICITLIYGCHESKTITNASDIDYIKSNIWHLDLSDFKKVPEWTDEQYYLYLSRINHCPIFFRNGALFFESIDNPYDSCFFSNDTLLITHSYYKFSFDTMAFAKDTVFLGKIIKINKDSLNILRIKDNLFGLLLGEESYYKTLRFYNDSLLIKNTLNFQTISISSGSCYGSCPIQAVEIDSSGSIFFYGKKHAYKEGFYNGKIDFSTLDTIKHYLSSALINRDVFKLYGVPNDAPGTEMKIILKNNDTFTINGTSREFNYRLWQIYYKLNTYIINHDLEKDSTEHKFLSTKYIENK